MDLKTIVVWISVISLLLILFDFRKAILRKSKRFLIGQMRKLTLRPLLLEGVIDVIWGVMKMVIGILELVMAVVQLLFPKKKLVAGGESK